MQIIQALRSIHAEYRAPVIIDNDTQEVIEFDEHEWESDIPAFLQAKGKTLKEVQSIINDCNRLIPLHFLTTPHQVNDARFKRFLACYYMDFEGVTKRGTTIKQERLETPRMV